MLVSRGAVLRAMLLTRSSAQLAPRLREAHTSMHFSELADQLRVKPPIANKQSSECDNVRTMMPDIRLATAIA